MNQYIINIIDALDKLPDDPQQLQRLAALSAELSWASSSDIEALLGEFAKRADDSRWESVCLGLEPVLARLTRITAQQATVELEPERLVIVEKLYRTPGTNERIRCYLLGWLASHHSSTGHQAFARLLTENPPNSSASVVLAFAPLLDPKAEYSVDWLFPQLWQAVQYPNMASAVLDLANFVTRDGRTQGRHPAADRAEALNKMLTGLIEKLAQIESGVKPAGIEVTQLSQLVNESVALMTSLCDALALIGDTRVVPALKKASQLKHRRIRAEALAALARLHDESAAAQLVQLAAEPVVRSRVIAYADELGLQSQIDERFLSPPAVAEGHLAMWLAQPGQMGVAPTSMELLDQRILFWPGYEDPVNCFLFQYQYALSGEPVINIGIASPLIHAFATSLMHLSVADVYACFAGWQCEHEEIQEYSLEQAGQMQPGLVEQLLSRAQKAEVSALQPSFVGFFMGEPVLIAAAVRGEDPGTLMVQENQTDWIAQGETDLHVRDEMAYCIYKGRRLLSTFNPPEYWPGEDSTSE